MPCEDEGRDLQGKGCQSLRANHQNLGDRDGQILFQSPEEANSADTLILDLQPLQL